MTDPISVGVDGTPDGWLAVRYEGDEFAGVERYEEPPELWEELRGAETVLIDIPIGLHEESAEPRPPDDCARGRLGWPRSSSVFAVPVRDAVHAEDYESAKETQENRTDGSLGKQSFNITDKIAAVDDLLTADGEPSQDTLREAHPEVCFRALNGGTPTRHSKTGQPAAAFWERVGILGGVDDEFRDALFAAGETVRTWDADLSNDDLLDAFALAVTASDLTGELRTLPDDPETDAQGLRMEMVYAEPE